MNKFFRETQRLYIQELNIGDEPLLMDLDSDPDVMRFLTDGKTSSEADIKAMLERVLGLFKTYSNKFGVWKVIDKVSGDFLGWVIFRPCKKNPTDTQNIELGYRFKKQFWGQGYASEASLPFLQYGFEELGIDSIFATAMKLNDGSTGVMKKLGLVWEEDYQEDQFPGPNKEAVRYRLKKEDWIRNISQR